MKKFIKYYLLLFILTLNLFCKPPYNTPQYNIPTDNYTNNYEKGVVFENKHLYKSAEYYFRKALQYAPYEMPVKRRYWRAYFRMVKQWENIGNFKKAYEGYIYISDKGKGDQYAPVSFYHAGIIACKLGNKQNSFKIFNQMIYDYPEHGLSSNALKHLKKCIPEQNYLEKIFTEMNIKLSGTDIDANILFEWANLEIENNRITQANLILEKLIKLYPYPCSLWDDAVWLLSKIAEQNSQWDKTIKYLENFYREKDYAYFVGSYNSQYTDDAIFKLGALYYEKKHNINKAIFYYEQLALDPYSTLSDDSMLELAKIYKFNLNKVDNSCEWLYKIKIRKIYSNKMKETNKFYNDWECKN